MVVLISACRVSGGQPFEISFSHRCPSVVRMSACSFCCSFTRWFRLFLFNLFFVGSLSFWCKGWSGILFIFSAWIRSLACLLPSSGSTPAVFSISAIGVVFHGAKDCPQADILNFFQFVGVRLGSCRPRRWPHIPEKAGQPPCRRFLESWSWHPSVFQTISSGTASFLMPFFSMSSMCGFHESRVSSFTPRKVGVSTWGSVLSPSFMVTFSLEVEREKNCGLGLHFTDLKTPSHLSTALPCSQLPAFCRQKMWCIQMRSKWRDHLHVGCWRHVGEEQS